MAKSTDRYLTIEEIVSLPHLFDTAISNDGQRVAFVKRTTNWDDNVYRNHVWVHDKELKTSRPVTLGKTESSYPRWSPDSHYIAYLSSVGEGDEKTTQIFVKSVDVAEGIQISHGEQSVETYKWAPDGSGFFYVAKAPVSEEKKKRKELYGDFEHIDQEYQYSSLYYIDLQKGKKANESTHLPKDLRDCGEEESVRPLTNGHGFHIYQFDVSPNGKTITLSAAPTPNIEDLHKQELYLLDVESQQLSKINTQGLYRGDVIFSYEGSQIGYTRYQKENAFYNNGILEIYDLNTEEKFQPLLDFDENMRLIRWVEKGILIEWQERTTYKIGLVSQDGEITPIVDDQDTVAHSSSITQDGLGLSYIKATPTEPLEVYLNDERITDQYKHYEGNLVSQKEVIRWKSLDGLEIEGILSIPPDFDPSKKYPLLVVIHGGPASASFAVNIQNKYYPIEQFIEKGFIVLEPNYRGSTGYGEAFRKANYRKLGTGDYEDVISGVDALVNEGIVDKDKVGVMGWSQGGYISAFCSTTSDRFKAISVGAGISNWMTYYVNTDIHQFTRMYLGDTPWNDEEIYRKTSPMTYIKSACTPTLIQHGEKDVRVPVPNAYELYQGLKDVGVHTELVVYKGMGHGSHKPGFNRAILKQNLVWFCHHILGESMDEFMSTTTRL
jgi:dipeptidyl aminopeptidase/acylaminoacyl peptidase